MASATRKPDMHDAKEGRARMSKRKLLSLVAGLVALMSCTQQKSFLDQETAEPSEWLPVPYDPESGVVTINDVEPLFDFVRRRVDAVPPKGEFETTKQWEVRSGDHATILAPMRLDKTYLVSPRNSIFEYNADEQVYTLNTHTNTASCFYQGGAYESFACDFATRVGEDGVSGYDFHFLVDGNQLSVKEQYRTQYLPRDCNVPLDQAPELKEHLSMAYGFQLDKAEVRYGQIREFGYGPKKLYYRGIGIPARLTHMVCFDARTQNVIYQESFLQ